MTSSSQVQKPLEKTSSPRDQKPLEKTSSPRVQKPLKNTTSASGLKELGLGGVTDAVEVASSPRVANGLALLKVQMGQQVHKFSAIGYMAILALSFQDLGVLLHKPSNSLC